MKAEYIVLPSMVLYLVVYYWLGLRLVARPFVTAAVEDYIAENADHWEAYRSQYPLDRQARLIEKERRRAAGEGIFGALVWPVLLLVRLLCGRLQAKAPLSTGEARIAIRQRDATIARLERELGVLSRSPQPNRP